LRSEPFQIFTLLHRKKLISQHPGMSSPEIMSTLGRMWQSLPQQTKASYAFVAFDSIKHPAPYRLRNQPRRSIVPLPVPVSPLEAEEQEEVELEPLELQHIRFPTIDPPLRFSIIARGESGLHVAAVSQLLILDRFPARLIASMAEGLLG
jgi:hypothetical protein